MQVVISEYGSGFLVRKCIGVLLGQERLGNEMSVRRGHPNIPWFEMTLSPHYTVTNSNRHCLGEEPVAIINNGCSHKTHGAIQKFRVCWFCKGAIWGKLLIHNTHLTIYIQLQLLGMLCKHNRQVWSNHCGRL